MNGPGRGLYVVPDARDATVLAWLAEPEIVDARPVLDAAFAQLAGIRQVRPWPWDPLIDVLRPIDRESRNTRNVLLVAAALILSLLVTGLLPGGFLTRPQVTPAPSPTAPTPGPSAPGTAQPPPAVVFRLADLDLAIANAGQDGNLYLDFTTGSPRKRVGEDILAGLVQPAWAPDGDRILVLAQTEDVEQQWEVDPRERPLGDPSQVVIPCTAPCVSRNEAAYSRDGGRIVFFEASGEVIGGVPSDCALKLYDRRSQEFQVVHAFACGVEEDREPRFSPDGTQIAFWRSRQDAGSLFNPVEDSAIFIRDLATGQERQLTDWEVHATTLDWSPDGRWITFIKDWWLFAGGLHTDIWRIRTDGTGEPEQLTDLGPEINAWQPRYSPDGEWILFARLDPVLTELWAVRADGSELVEVLPGGGQIYQFDVLPAELVGADQPNATPSPSAT